MAIQRETKRAGRLFIRVFPDKPVTKKPLETRMGTGKGAVEEYVAIVLPGRVLFELDGVTREMAEKAFRLASNKLPISCKVLVRSEQL
jgi:large subunit ribosomal protein L16